MRKQLAKLFAFHLAWDTHGAVKCEATHHAIVFVSRPRHINVKCSAVRPTALATLSVKSEEAPTDEVLIELADPKRLLVCSVVTQGFACGFKMRISGYTEEEVPSLVEGIVGRPCRGRA